MNRLFQNKNKKKQDNFDYGYSQKVFGACVNHIDIIFCAQIVFRFPLIRLRLNRNDIRLQCNFNFVWRFIFIDKSVCRVQTHYSLTNFSFMWKRKNIEMKKNLIVFMFFPIIRKLVIDKLKRNRCNKYNKYIFH